MTIDTLHRYFVESLHWDAPKGMSSFKFSLDGHPVEAHPLAQAGRAVAFGVVAGEPLSRRARRKVCTVLMRRTHRDVLAVFVDPAGAQAVWRWQTGERHAAFPPEAAKQEWLSILRLPLDSPPTPEAVRQRLDAALPPRAAAAQQQTAEALPALLAAFDQLLQALDATVNDGAELAKQAFAGRSELSLDEVARLHKSLVALKDKVNALRSEAQALLQEFPALAQQQTSAEPTEVYPAPRPKQKRGRGERTPQSAYRCPILRALIELGGRGKVRQVLDRVYAQMKDRLLPRDLVAVPSGQDVVWSVSAKWQRNKMKLEGLLRDDSPAGIWEITDAGRRYYEQHCARTSAEPDQAPL